MNMDSSLSPPKLGKPPAPAPAPAPAGPRPPAAAAAAPGLVDSFPQEKRRYPRFKCEGNLELKTEGSTIRTWATLTDISTTGCYVEIMTTFPVGTKVEMQIGMNGFLVNGAAVVRATYPFLGMGIEFTNLSQNAREQLDAMIASVTVGRRSVPPSQKKILLPAISEPMAVVNALEQFFETKPLLSAEEFVSLVTSSQNVSSQSRKP